MNFDQNRSNSREARNARLDADLEAIRKAQEVGSDVEDTDDGVVPVKNDPWEKRYADLRSFKAKQDAERDAEIKSLKKQLADAAKQQIKFPKSEEEVDEWVKKYPDVAGIVETIALKKVSELKGQMDARDEALQAAAREFDKQKAFDALLKAHPDFLDIRADEAFHEWVEKQVKWVRDALYENDTDADSAITAIDLYKAKTGYGQKKEKPKAANPADAARSVNRPDRSAPRDSDTGDMIKESDVAKMNVKEYSARRAEIDKAIATGKFLYDLSGAAR